MAAPGHPESSAFETAMGMNNNMFQNMMQIWNMTSSSSPNSAISAMNDSSIGASQNTVNTQFPNLQIG